MNLDRCAYCNTWIDWIAGPDGFGAYDPVPVIVAQTDAGTVTTRRRHTTTCPRLDRLPPVSCQLRPATLPAEPPPPPPGRAVALARGRANLPQP